MFVRQSLTIILSRNVYCFLSSSVIHSVVWFSASVVFPVSFSGLLTFSGFGLFLFPGSGLFQFSGSGLFQFPQFSFQLFVASQSSHSIIKSGLFAASSNDTTFHLLVTTIHSLWIVLYTFLIPPFTLSQFHGLTAFIARISQIIVHHSSAVGRVSQWDFIISHVSGSITSCQKTTFIACSAATIHANSADTCFQNVWSHLVKSTLISVVHVGLNLTHINLLTKLNTQKNAAVCIFSFSSGFMFTLSKNFFHSNGFLINFDIALNSVHFNIFFQIANAYFQTL